MHRPCRPVTTYDDALVSLVADMVATMRAADGVGLAANQIGHDVAVFVFDCPTGQPGESVAGVVCNPVLTIPGDGDRNLDVGDEGCLSLPGAFVECARLDHAQVNGFDHHGQAVMYVGDGLLARCLQHETDHLSGIVFGDKVPTKQRKRLFEEAAEVADDYPIGWPAQAS